MWWMIFVVLVGLLMFSGLCAVLVIGSLWWHAPTVYERPMTDEEIDQAVADMWTTPLPK